METTVTQVLKTVVPWQQLPPLIERTSVILGGTDPAPYHLKLWYDTLMEKLQNPAMAAQITEADLYSWILEGGSILQATSQSFTELKKQMDIYERQGKMTVDQAIDNKRLLRELQTQLFGCQPDTATYSWYPNLIKLLPANLDSRNQQILEQSIQALEQKCDSLIEETAQEIQQLAPPVPQESVQALAELQKQQLLAQLPQVPKTPLPSVVPEMQPVRSTTQACHECMRSASAKMVRIGQHNVSTAPIKVQELVKLNDNELAWFENYLKDSMQSCQQCVKYCNQKPRNTQLCNNAQARNLASYNIRMDRDKRGLQLIDDEKGSKARVYRQLQRLPPAIRK